MGFRENLKSQLEYSGMLVKELAAISGIKKKTIDSYLGNRGYIPSVEAAVRIAKALGVTVEYLVTDKDTKTDRPFSSLQNDIQEIVLVSEQLNPEDRFVILNLARLLQKSHCKDVKKSGERNGI
jgi:transcriptional regulator with XRE-family HTH domain